MSVGSVLGGLAGVVSAGDVVKKAAEAVVGASGLSGVTGGGDVAGGGPSPTLTSDTMEDERFLDEVALKISGSPVSALRVIGLWKGNRKAVRTPENLSLFKEMGLIVDGSSESDQKFLDRFALEVSASPLPADQVLGLWKGNRKAMRTPENLSLMKEWGLI